MCYCSSHGVPLGFDAEHTTKMFVDAYGPSSSVADGNKLIKYTKELQRVKHEGLPINGPWVNRAVKEFVEAVVKGSKETGVWCGVFVTLARVS